MNNLPFTTPETHSIEAKMKKRKKEKKEKKASRKKI
jgi:hypothetical protein